VTSLLGPLLLTITLAAGAPRTEAMPPSGATVIAVIVPADANAPMLDALNRLRGEADSVGFALRLVDASTGMDPQTQIAEVARTLAPAAVVALQSQRTAHERTAEASPEAAPETSVEAGPAPAGGHLGVTDVWFLDRATGATSVGHLTVEADAGDRADLVLAVRVVDFIRARMFDALVRSSARQDRAPRPPRKPIEVAGPGWVGGGLAATGSFSGFSTALLPWVEVGYRPWTRGGPAWLEWIAGLGGLGSQPSRATSDGSATLDQTLLVAGVALRGRLLWRFFPTATLGASALFVSIRGEGKPGYLGHDRMTWSPGLFATAGTGLVIARHVQWRVGIGGTVLARQPQIFINGVEVAATGRPAWLAQTSLGVSF
jgi:hypothetical protein